MNYIRVGTACPLVKVANISYNVIQIKECVDKAFLYGTKFLVFPELSITAYTCADLFLQETLITESINALKDLCEYSIDKDMLIVVGAPIVFRDSLYNCAVCIFEGKILGIVPKSFIPNYTEFYEKRWFSEGINIVNEIIELPFQGNIPFGINTIFSSGLYKFAVEICEDLWVTIPPSSYSTLAGANIVANLSASNELVSKSDYRKNLVNSQSARCLCAYLYSSSGVMESTTDLVFSGHMLIAENGLLLQENERFQRESQILTCLIDIDKLKAERIKNTSFSAQNKMEKSKFNEVKFAFKDISNINFDRFVDRTPFVPMDKNKRIERCKEIFNIQTAGLAKRLLHTGMKKAVIGISGGLDSTLALLVIIKTFDMLCIDKENIYAITMPGFGTTDRTYNNAVSLCKMLDTSFKEINIIDASLQHFKDIEHDVNVHDVTYENVQARERTQILMDIANKVGGLVVGTGDLSEIALGWSTYNGDHMSMYSVNCSIPKTLVRYLVSYVAEFEMDDNVASILRDILDTPVSPELLPKSSDNKIVQKTEDIVGPYELHDFFLYYFIKLGASPDKILLLANSAFRNIYDSDTIKKWLKKFLQRFFTQQFKRSAIPDGPKVGTISLSPRGDWRMPSDADFNEWMKYIL
ncbi:NAD(+) synthase [Clostridium sp. 19966]|uniref:NAD(+) synthase n=1 Tax=Clostridium sp. 19966 TaxID=2768166 RepID=UPI0028DF7C72|nr:NAD(+) synthase [Clostridium sp. 19966]MDT8716346.1 NAD(+) synthase [Clostridium sp. 19966]